MQLHQSVSYQKSLTFLKVISCTSKLSGRYAYKGIRERNVCFAVFCQSHSGSSEQMRPHYIFFCSCSQTGFIFYTWSLSHSCSETKIVFCLIFSPQSSAIFVTRINLSLIWMHDGIKWKLAFCLFTVPWCPCLMNIMWLQQKRSIIFHHIVAKKPRKHRSELAAISKTVIVTCSHISF